MIKQIQNLKYSIWGTQEKVVIQTTRIRKEPVSELKTEVQYREITELQRNSREFPV